ncbi:MAG: ParA family protein [Actinomycetota bacterium]|nr:ParA family protein [Actinomycetota bacterium]
MESQGFEGTEAGGQPADVSDAVPTMDDASEGAPEQAPAAIDPRVDDPSKRGGAAIPEPTPLDQHGPARIIAMVNQKGGVGKTTSTVSLGAALASYGRRVLLVDFDPQGAVSVALGINPNELDLTIYNALTQAGCHVGDVVMSTDVIDLDLLPANIDLSAAEVQLVSEVGREHALGRVLAPIKDEYDIILIDCQPSLGLLTLNALTAASGVIIPMGTEYFALRGVALLKDTIDKVTSRLNPDLEIIGVLPTMYDARTLHAREVLSTVQQAFGDLVFQTVIHRTVKFQDAAVAGEPITDFAPGSSGAEAYRQLAREVLAR